MNSMPVTPIGQGSAVTVQETVTLQLDGRAHELPVATRLSDLVASLGHSPDAVGTAVNGMFVARAQREACVLRQGDAVLLFRPIVGG
jgi:sulfur carrier protein